MVATDVHADVVAHLHAWTPLTEDQHALRQDYLSFLAAHEDGHLKPCRAGHVTASALIIDPERERVLLTLHPKVGRWLQTGGHIEPTDVSLTAAALREAREESGIAGLTLSAHPLRLDRHLVPCQPDVLLHHLDIQFAAIAPPDAAHAISAESLDLQWWPWEALPETDHSVLALVEAARQWVSTAPSSTSPTGA